MLVALSRWRRVSNLPFPATREPAVAKSSFGISGADMTGVVEGIVPGSTPARAEYLVRTIAMPGSNLDLKFFLGVAGGDPPDVVNQDDPIVGDWAERGTLIPIDELATPARSTQFAIRSFQRRFHSGAYRNRMYALCNGLDVRLYYDADVLAENSFEPPRTIEELDAAAKKVAPPNAGGNRTRYGFLPDPRRIWAWAIVFGGQFYDPVSGALTVDHRRNIAALDWMASYSRTYGRAEVLQFRPATRNCRAQRFRYYKVVMR